MSDKKNTKKEKSFSEKVVEQFPKDFRPDYRPKEFDPINDTGKDIIAQTGVKEIFRSMMIEESDKSKFDLFWDAIVEKKSKEFEAMRAGIKDDNIRRQLLKKIIEASKYGKRK